MQLLSRLAEYFRPRSLGERGEAVAARFLRRQGYRIVAARSRSRYGELDLVAVDGKTVVFVEVKTRRSLAHGRPALAVDRQRRERLVRAGLAFLKSRGLLGYASRFDIVEVVWPHDQRRPEITHHRNAFQASSQGQFFR